MISNFTFTSISHISFLDSMKHTCEQSWLVATVYVFANLCSSQT